MSRFYKQLQLKKEMAVKPPLSVCIPIGYMLTSPTEFRRMSSSLICIRYTIATPFE